MYKQFKFNFKTKVCLNQSESVATRFYSVQNGAQKNIRFECKVFIYQSELLTVRTSLLWLWLCRRLLTREPSRTLKIMFLSVTSMSWRRWRVLWGRREWLCWSGPLGLMVLSVNILQCPYWWRWRGAFWWLLSYSCIVWLHGGGWARINLFLLQVQ